MIKMLLIFCALLFSACSDKEVEQSQQPILTYQQPVVQQPTIQPQLAQQPLPVVIQSAPAQSSGMQDMLIGGIIGHAISSGSSSQQRTIVNKTVINKTVINKPYRRQINKRK